METPETRTIKARKEFAMLKRIPVEKTEVSVMLLDRTHSSSLRISLHQRGIMIVVLASQVLEETQPAGGQSV